MATATATKSKAKASPPADVEGDILRRLGEQQDPAQKRKVTLKLFSPFSVPWRPMSGSVMEFLSFRDGAKQWADFQKTRAKGGYPAEPFRTIGDWLRAKQEARQKWEASV